MTLCSLLLLLPPLVLLLCAVCTGLPQNVSGIAAWPDSCNGKSSCTATCMEGWVGSATVMCGPDNRWMEPLKTCIQELGELLL
jgi:hypothetical protein